MNETVLLIHAGATLCMTGLIWFVQVVHYPLFHCLDPEHAREYAKRHQSRTTLVVLPLMLAELAASIVIALNLFQTDVPGALGWIGFGLVVLIWLSTFCVQVPLHRRLSAGHDPRTVTLLVSTNWVRTLSWTARGVLSLTMLSL